MLRWIVCETSFCNHSVLRSLMVDQVDRRALARKWVHSHEEDTPDKTVFRPETYKFPPSRGRKSFELRPDGTMVHSGIGPDDRPSSRTGLWQLKDANTLVLQPGDSNTQSTI